MRFVRSTGFYGCLNTARVALYYSLSLLFSGNLGTKSERPAEIPRLFDSSSQNTERQLTISGHLKMSRGTTFSHLKHYLRTTFSSLRLRNYRLYFIGQGISLSGTWMQTVAQSWLVLELTHSGALLGLVSALQFLPVFALAPYGGLLADRFSKRRILLITQSASAMLAIALGTLVATGAIRVWMVFVFAFCLGVINAIDNPTRQSFVHELVGPRQLKNAVTLNSLEINMSRVVGPAIAGILIAKVGLAPCFLFNGFSFMATLVCLVLMTAADLHRGTRVEAAKGQLLEGFRYVRNTPVIVVVLIMMSIVGMLTYEFPVTLPLLARYTFHGSADSYALLTSSMGAGAVLGGLAIAGRRRATVAGLTVASLLFGLSVLLVALAPGLVWAAAGMVVVGAFSIAFTSLSNTILQLEAAAEMRGRVMALWTVAFLGSTLIGAPVVGWVSQSAGPRWGIVLGGAAALIASLFGLSVLRSGRRPQASEAAVQAPSIGEKADYA